MASIFATSGTTVAMTATTTAPTTYDATGYTALTYVPLGCLSNIGSFGDTSETVTFDCIAEKRTLKIKGQRNAGALDLTIALDDTTTGFDTINAAAADDSTGDYHFKITFPNKQASAGAGAIRYFSGKVMSNIENLGAANDVVTIGASVEINTAIVKVDSTAS